jgi:hypothetical protein
MNILNGSEHRSPLLVPVGSKIRGNFRTSRIGSDIPRLRWHGLAHLAWTAYAIVCCGWFIGSAMSHDWTPAGFALLAVAGCALEGRNFKGRYHRTRRPTFMDEPPPQPPVSALTQHWATQQELAGGEWSVDTHDTAGNPMHACSRGANCTHVPAAKALISGP